MTRCLFNCFSYFAKIIDNSVVPLPIRALEYDDFDDYELPFVFITEAINTQPKLCLWRWSFDDRI